MCDLVSWTSQTSWGLNYFPYYEIKLIFRLNLIYFNCTSKTTFKQYSGLMLSIKFNFG